MTVLPVAEIPRSTVAAWRLYLDWSAGVRATNPRYLDAVACSRTATATIYRYDDLRDVEQPVWTFSVDERRHNGHRDLQGETWAHPLIASGDEVDYATWRECFDAAHAAVSELRGVE